MLLPLLIEEMAGIHRLPFLLFYQPDMSLDEIFLHLYEIVYIEPLHAIKGHISNLYEEIPKHLSEDQRRDFKAAVDVSFPKDAKNGSDYRKSLIEVCILMAEKMDSRYYNLLLQMVEIQQIAYQGESQRTAAQIFRFSNISFMHVITMKELFKKALKLTFRLSLIHI